MLIKHPKQKLPKFHEAYILKKSFRDKKVQFDFGFDFVRIAAIHSTKENQFYITTRNKSFNTDRPVEVEIFWGLYTLYTKKHAKYFSEKPIKIDTSSLKNNKFKPIGVTLKY